MRMSMSFLARWISTRRGMAREVGNPGHNSVVRGRWEAANAFKVRKELNKRKCISPWDMRTEKTGNCGKDWRMLKTRYQKWRRFEDVNKIIESKRSIGGMWRRDRGRGGWWRRNRPGTLRLVNRASRLLRRRRIYKKFGDTRRSESSREDFHRDRYRRGCCRRRRIYNSRRRRRRRINWPKDDASGLLLLGSFLWNVRIFFIWIWLGGLQRDLRRRRRHQLICRNPERSEECLSDQVVVERQCLDKASEAATRFFTKCTRALSI